MGLQSHLRPQLHYLLCVLVSMPSSGVRTLHGSRLDVDSEKPAKRKLAYTSCAKRKDEIEMIFLEILG